jgi:hypothetical protein
VSTTPGEDLLARALQAELTDHLNDDVRDRDATVDRLQAALRSCRSIGTAVGILMSTQALTRDAAFGALVATGRELHLNVGAVAVYVTETGELPARR